jgi:hypothetical protein
VLLSVDSNHTYCFTKACYLMQHVALSTNSQVMYLMEEYASNMLEVFIKSIFEFLSNICYMAYSESRICAFWFLPMPSISTQIVYSAKLLFKIGQHLQQRYWPTSQKKKLNVDQQAIFSRSLAIEIAQAMQIIANHKLMARNETVFSREAYNYHIQQGDGSYANKICAHETEI